MGYGLNYSAQTCSPATIVRTARPFSSQPWKGVLRLRLEAGFAVDGPFEARDR